MNFIIEIVNYLKKFFISHLLKYILINYLREMSHVLSWFIDNQILKTLTEANL